MRPLRTAAAALVALVGCTVIAPPASADLAPPVLRVSTVVSGLVIPWDVAFTPDGTMLVTERRGRILLRTTSGAVREVSADLGDLWVSGETGLMGIETDPDFATNRVFYTCQGTTDGDDGVQVVRWQLNAALTAATRVADPLVGGIPGSTGRHGGCQLRIDAQGHLRIGTGDAAVGTYPQDKGSLAGKTLRVVRSNGGAVSSNPFFGSTPGDDRIFTLGHRNVQGLALQPGGTVWSVEHGPSRDDEVNRTYAGANFGWDPVPDYDESTPMTKPGFVAAAWSSGAPTIATSGATFLRGSRWGAWDGALAVAALKDSSVRIFGISGTSARQVAQPDALDDDLGRVRGAELGPDGRLYLTTSNGTDDRVVAVTPVSPITAKHQQLGGDGGFLGTATGAETGVPGGRYREYERGAIWWGTRTGAWEVHGDIRQRWYALGRHTSALGFPRTDERRTPDGRGRYNHFQRGSVYWTSTTGAHEVRGDIHSTWSRLGWERSPLRYPTTDELAAGDGRGRYNRFQGGSIWWTATTGAHDVRGDIGRRWAALGAERSVLRYPTTGERRTPDGRGRYNHFERGSVYWTPTTGAHEVYGAIRVEWAERGWERSSLGYPVSGEYSVPGGRRSDFEGGSLVWDSSTGDVRLVR